MWTILEEMTGDEHNPMIADFQVHALPPQPPVPHSCLFAFPPLIPRKCDAALVDGAVLPGGAG